MALSSGLVTAGVGTFEAIRSEFGGTTLVILTYPSLLGGDCGGSPAFNAAFAPFASAHGIRIEVECPGTNLYSSLRTGAGAPAADLVIGLDELTTPEAEAAGLLVPYAPSSLADVPAALTSQLSPEPAGVPYAVPYEYGYLAVDYNASFLSAYPSVAHLHLSDLAANVSWARTLLVEDPAIDITGEEFLVWQIQYYEQVLHQNWTTFWTAMPSGVPPLSDSWDDAFAEFQAGVQQMVVSYSTDPAYALAYGAAGYYNATVSWYNGTPYGWRTIYGVGIVNGTHHLALDEQFENWMLGGAVQQEIPTNEWEYPANDTVPLPSVFSAAIDPSTIVALNAAAGPAAVAASWPGWLHTWEGLTGGAG